MIQRMDFLKKAFAFSATTAFALQLSSALSDTQQGLKEWDGITFLVKGDAVTDSNHIRDKAWNQVIGHGYQYTIANKLWCDFPQKRLHFFDCGISDDKVTVLAARRQKDMLDIKPDVVIVLIGNDDKSTFINGINNFTVEKFESNYRALMHQTKEQLPGMQLVFCKPFVLPIGNVKEHWYPYSRETG